tara:strand:- start:6622 stop:7248 length:627 start_codon:yes stop_codon:yes gene_type:complete
MKYQLKDPMMVPPTGFVYTQPETGAKLDGQSMSGTISLMLRHRTANGLPRQTFEEASEDLQQQLCQQLGYAWCKNMVVESWSFRMDWDTIKAGTRTLMALAGEKLAGGNPYVDQAEAERRAAICCNCFANKRMGECLSCGLANLIQQLVAESVQPGATSKDDRLSGCMVCGCLLTKKVHVKDEIIKAGLSDKQKAAYAEIPACWMNGI